MSDEALISGTRIYSVGGKSPVFLSVTIGDLQAGGSSVLWEGEIIAEGEITMVRIGKPGEWLQHKSVRVTTKVRDINPSTNRTSVTYTLEGGSARQSYPFWVQVSESSTALYSICFVFV